MAIDVRTIQMRRGLAVDFNPAKMVPGEWAVSQDNEKLYMCFTAGRVIEIGTASAIISYVEDAEAWAVGTRSGEPVDNTDPTYHNNSKYYSEQGGASATAAAISETNAATSESNASAWAVGKRSGHPVPSTDPTYENNSKYYSEVAVDCADDAKDSKENSEAWAVGTKNGVPVSSSDPQYQNSAKDWAETAEAIVGIGIATTERAGIVKPDGETILVEPDGEILAPNVNSATEELLKDTVGWTGKNLIPYPYLQTTKTINRVTFTDNADGTITVDTESSGASAFSQFICHDRYNTERNEFFIPNGTYILSGCPSGDSSSSYRMGAVITKNGTYQYLGFDTGSSVEVTVNGDDYSNYGAYLGIVIDIASGTITSNKVFKPMLRLASVNDATYEPYHKPVSEWAYTRNEASILGAKNLLPYPYYDTSKVYRGITFTDNGDGSVLVNGTATEEVAFEFNASYAQVPIEDGKYIVSGCPSGGSSSTYMIQYTLRNISAGTTSWLGEFGNGAKFTETSNIKYGYSRILIKSGTVCNNLLFKPMIRLASDSDDTWQPYAMTNRELTGKVGTLAPLDSPAFTGTPTAPTAASSTQNTQIATTSFVHTIAASKYDSNDPYTSTLSDDDTHIPILNTSGQITTKRTKLGNIRPVFILRTGLTATAGTTIRIPASGTNEFISYGCHVEPVCDSQSGKGIKYDQIACHDYEGQAGYVEIRLAQNITNRTIGIKVIGR